MKNILILLTVFILSSCGEDRKITRIDRDTPEGKELWSQIENSTFEEMKKLYGQPTTVQTMPRTKKTDVYWDDNLLIKQEVTGWWCRLRVMYNSEEFNYSVNSIGLIYCRK